MQYNFDKIIERRGSNCIKWDTLKSLYGRDDLTPMWVADMDFPSPDFVIEALRQRCNHEVLGYPTPPQTYWQAIKAWLTKHYNIQVTEKDLHFIPGIVAGIAYTLLCLTKPNDRVLVTTPVYPPFLNLPRASHRILIDSPLKIENGRFAIDFDDFEHKADGCKLFIMSNPHNPAGTVWGVDTLQKVSEICDRKGILVVSDEIHADLTLPGYHHVSYSTVSAAAAQHSITFTAPSKTFNIAGMGSSVCYIANADLRQRFFSWLDSLGIAGGNIFAFTAAEAAYSKGEQWLEQMRNYLKENVATLSHFAKSNLPLLKIVLPEASYLAWLDFSNYGLTHKQLKEILINQAHVALNDGTTFVISATTEKETPYQCCFRINLGCPKNTLSNALQRIAAALPQS